RSAYSGRFEGSSESFSRVRVESGSTTPRLASAKRTMKPSTSAAATTSHWEGRTRRALIETGGRILISSGPSRLRFEHVAYAPSRECEGTWPERTTFTCRGKADARPAATAHCRGG